MNALVEFDLASNPTHQIIVGVDEAGRGPLAGPVFAAAVALDYNKAEAIAQINDSKKVAPRKRKALFEAVRSNCIDHAIAFSDHTEIDGLNIHHASLNAMFKAVSKLRVDWGKIWIDGRFILPQFEEKRQEAIIKGDGKSACIAAASILAKVSRDELMEEYHDKYPQYAFNQHKGYGTKLHRDRLLEHGPCSIHRRSFCSNYLTATAPIQS